MATVFLARDLQHDRLVALKALKPDVAHAIGAERFLREIRIIARLSHPNIVGLVDSGVSGQDQPAIPWYVMPYVEGETLRERLRREVQLPVDDAIRIASEVAEALAYAHDHHVIHRDVKPENILLQGGRALVADFGIARMVGQQLASTAVSTGSVTVGTPHYMSPEQWDAGQRIDARSDIYSLACVLYEMLGGEPPFTGATVVAIGARHRSQPVPSLRVVRGRLPSHLIQVIDRALAKVPADRFQSALEFRDALIGATGAGLRYSWRRSRRWWAAGVTLAGVVAVVVLVLSNRDPVGPEIFSLNPTDIAVLPLVDQVDAPETRSLAATLTDRLALRLDSVRGIRVRSLEVTRPLAHLPLDSIMHGTRAGIVVSGALSGTPSQVAVTVRVNDSETPEYAIGMQSWVRPVGQVLLLSDSLAEEITRFVLRTIGQNVSLRERLEVLPADTRRVVREARSLQQDSRADFAAGNPGEASWKLLRADTLLLAAERQQGNSTIATVERGWVAEALARIARPDLVAWRDWLDQGVGHANQALQRNPRDPWARELRGTLYWMLAEEPQGQATLHFGKEAENDLVAALEANSSLARALATLSRIRLTRGDFAGAAAYARRALDVDPFLREARPTLTVLFNAELGRERFEEAAQVCEQSRTLYPRDPNFIGCRLQVLGWSGRTPAEVQRAWSEVAALDPLQEAGLTMWGWNRLFIAAMLARAGERDSAWAVIRAVKRRESEPGDMMEARVYALLGQSDSALAYLERVLRVQPGYRERFAAEPWFRGLRDDPRFQRLVAPP